MTTSKELGRRFAVDMEMKAIRKAAVKDWGKVIKRCQREGNTLAEKIARGAQANDATAMRASIEMMQLLHRQDDAVNLAKKDIAKRDKAIAELRAANNAFGVYMDRHGVDIDRIRKRAPMRFKLIRLIMKTIKGLNHE